MKVKELWKLSDDLKKISKKLKKYFPDFYEKTLDIEVRPWVEELSEKFDIDRPTFKRRILGFSDRVKRYVMFRDMPPSPIVVIHELAHIYYNLDEIELAHEHAGTEKLIWLIVNENLSVKDPEKFIREWISVVRRSLSEDEEERKKLTEEIVEKIITKTKLNAYPHLYAIYLFAGTIPDIPGEYWRLPPDSPEWEDVPVDYSQEPYHFLQELSEGIVYSDPFYLAFARAIFENF